MEIKIPIQFNPTLLSLSLCCVIQYIILHWLSHILVLRVEPYQEPDLVGTCYKPLHSTKHLICFIVLNIIFYFLEPIIFYFLELLIFDFLISRPSQCKIPGWLLDPGSSFSFIFIIQLYYSHQTPMPRQKCVIPQHQLTMTSWSSHIFSAIINMSLGFGHKTLLCQLFVEAVSGDSELPVRKWSCDGC